MAQKTHRRDAFIKKIKFTDGWPESLPTLEAEDMHVGWFTGKGGSHCLLGWVSQLSYYEGIPQQTFTNALRAELEQVILDEGYPGGTIVDFNDNHSKAGSAKVWNRAIERLGYTQDTLIK